MAVVLQKTTYLERRLKKVDKIIESHKRKLEQVERRINYWRGRQFRARVWYLLSGAAAYVLMLNYNYWPVPPRYVIFATLALAYFMPMTYPDLQEAEKERSAIWSRRPTEEYRRRRDLAVGFNAETLVNNRLKSLPDDYYLIPDLNLGSGYQIDHLVIGPRGIIVFETKSLAGNYAACPNPAFWYGWARGGWQLIDSPQRQAKGNAERLARLLCCRPIPVVVLVNGKYQGPWDPGCPVVNPNQIIPLINSQPGSIDAGRTRGLYDRAVKLDTESDHHIDNLFVSAG